ncbi:MAG: PEP/pyruvate-binding domain-containing protein [Anaerolineales bacterium]|nr:PEP/pyruvate-binding domain-containing protein [Anaerolineales bacterium]
MTLRSSSEDRALNIFLALAQYPILSGQIRALMRQELYQRGVISAQAFEAEVREKAMHSQELEGLHDPLAEEPAEVWELRMMRIRDHLTDFYFAYNLPYDLFEQLVRQVLSERGAHDLISFNPELAPQRLLFEQGYALERLPARERALSAARLAEIKVVLIRSMISDHLPYVNIAKEWFTISDLQEIKRRKIGSGKIGGKAAGMLLARRILIEAGEEDIRAHIAIPESYFIGADMTYDFMSLNGLMGWLDQKYKPEEQIRREFPILQNEFLSAELPVDFEEKLRKLLAENEKRPLIVRSSSLLEDNFGTSFAGKYESHFCPNQADPQHNLGHLSRAIRRIYASIFNPDALLYRRARHLQDYDERMAILIQVVQGEPLGRYFLPPVSGVGYSQNLFRWSPQIRKEDGFLRLVWGLGTRAVERTENDYTRMVALSHPTLHPEVSTKTIRHYSQRYVDVIDLEQNAFCTLPVQEVLHKSYRPLRYLAELDQGGYLVPLRGAPRREQMPDLVLTFDELLRRTPIARRMSAMLQTLEAHYHSPIDLEFTLRIPDPGAASLEVEVCILQCRPQTLIKEDEVDFPTNIPLQDVVFSSRRMVPQGRVSGVRYVVFVTPDEYFALPTAAERARLARWIGELNARLTGEAFICLGPGRWGTSNPDLGIPVRYGDVYSTAALVEVTGEGIGFAPEASYGTHFFQDLIESGIYPLAIYLDDEGTVFNREFFYATPNRLNDFLPTSESLPACLRLIEVESYRPGCRLELVMSNSRSEALAYLQPG